MIIIFIVTAILLYLIGVMLVVDAVISFREEHMIIRPIIWTTLWWIMTLHMTRMMICVLGG